MKPERFNALRYFRQWAYFKYSVLLTIGLGYLAALANLYTPIKVWMVKRPLGIEECGDQLSWFPIRQTRLGTAIKEYET